MTQEDILQIIESHPDLSYEDAKIQARAAGISIQDFNAAWEAYLKKIRKPKPSKKWIPAYVISLIVIMLLGFETAYWRFLIKTPNEIFAKNFGALAFLCAIILMLHLASKFAGGRGNIITTTQFSIILLLIAYFTRLLTSMNAMFFFIIMLFGAVLIGFFVFYAIMKIYDLNIIHTFFLILLFAIFMAIIIQLTIGLTNFVSAYFPRGSEIQINSAVNISEEKPVPSLPSIPSNQQQ